MTPIETVLQFLERINERDPDKVADLLTEDHLFVDSLGQTMRGRETMRKGWRVYADNKPVYEIMAKSAKPGAN